MIKNLFVWLAIFAFASICPAQETEPNKPAEQQQQQQQQQEKEAARFSVELLDKLDVEKAARSDTFQLELSDDLKIGDKTLAKGTRINGRIVRSEKVSKDKESSLLSLYIGSVKEGDGYFRFNAAIVAIGSADQTSSGEMQFAPAPNFQGATIITLPGKNLRFEKGTVFQLKLDEPTK